MESSARVFRGFTCGASRYTRYTSRESRGRERFLGQIRIRAEKRRDKDSRHKDWHPTQEPNPGDVHRNPLYWAATKKLGKGHKRREKLLLKEGRKKATRRLPGPLGSARLQSRGPRENFLRRIGYDRSTSQIWRFVAQLHELHQVSKNLVEAVRYFKPATVQGNAEGQSCFVILMGFVGFAANAFRETASRRRNIASRLPTRDMLLLGGSVGSCSGKVKMLRRTWPDRRDMSNLPQVKWMPILHSVVGFVSRTVRGFQPIWRTRRDISNSPPIKETPIPSRSGRMRFTEFGRRSTMCQSPC